MPAAGSGKSVLDVNWAYVATMANILVSGTLHKLVPRVWEPPAMLVGPLRSGACDDMDLGAPWHPSLPLAVCLRLYVCYLDQLVYPCRLASHERLLSTGEACCIYDTA